MSRNCFALIWKQVPVTRMNLASVLEDVGTVLHVQPVKLMLFEFSNAYMWPSIEVIGGCVTPSPAIAVLKVSVVGEAPLFVRGYWPNSVSDPLAPLVT